MNNIFINDRSNLEEVICIIPVGHKDNSTDKAIKVARREDLERHNYHRTDIVLWTGRSGQQYCIYATSDGVTGSLFLLELLTDEQYTQVMNIVARMQLNAQEYPPAAKLLVN